MKPLYFYLLTIVSGLLLVTTFVTKNIYFVIVSFFIALYLKRHIDSIPLPKFFEKNKVVNINKLKEDK